MGFSLVEDDVPDERYGTEVEHPFLDVHRLPVEIVVEQYSELLPALLPKDHGLTAVIHERLHDVVRRELYVRHVCPSARTFPFPAEIVPHPPYESLDGGVVQERLPRDDYGLQRLPQ
ncbi:hypothetical protein [Kitasatospora phosalacinea]|uniref:hypothetical protein n=1 Tax=Kitasatospora phosalacinea TaxID=2065 RepID=UPI00052468FF|nr:hypothetical protein [Kitasatospora phosalacinea]